MEILQLKYFETVARYENMTQAAKKLSIAQPAVSQSIARLEDELGVKLFERRGRRIYLNDNGRYLLNKLPSMLAPFDSIKMELADLVNDSNQQICILVLSGSVLMPELLMSFRRTHPNTEFILIQDEKTAHYDLCITSTPVEKIEDEAEILLDEEIALVVPVESWLAKKEQVNLKELVKEDFISLGKGSAFRGITDYYCKQAEFKPHIIFESDNPSTVRGLIEVGLGVAFYPLKTWGSLSSSSLKVITIADVNFRRRISIKIPKGKYVSNVVREFYNFALAYYKNLSDNHLS